MPPRIQRSLVDGTTEHDREERVRSRSVDVIHLEHEVLRRLDSVHAHLDSESSLDECFRRNRARLHELRLVSDLDIRERKERRDRVRDDDTLRPIRLRLRTSGDRSRGRRRDARGRRHREDELSVLRRLLSLEERPVWVIHEPIARSGMAIAPALMGKRRTTRGTAVGSADDVVVISADEKFRTENVVCHVPWILSFVSGFENSLTSESLSILRYASGEKHSPRVVTNSLALSEQPPPQSPPATERLP